MRLHPSVGLTMPRIVPAGGIEVAGRKIPQGYRIGMNAAVIHRDKSIFGYDADEFRPSRWFEGDATVRERHLLTFGAGTRTDFVERDTQAHTIHFAKVRPRAGKFRGFLEDTKLVVPQAKWP